MNVKNYFFVLLKAKNYFLMLCVAMISLIACDKKNEPNNPDQPGMEKPGDKYDPNVKCVGISTEEIIFDQKGGNYRIMVITDVPWTCVYDPNSISVVPDKGNENTIVTITKQAGTESETDKITFYNAGGSITLSVYRMMRDLKFSVSATKKVQFAPGNLQYQASTNTWRFAEHQYDIIGAANSNISGSYNGWIDLFGWGTGNNPTSTSTSDYNYSTFVDWGQNKIGSDAANTWRTLSIDEWDYLLESRENAEQLNAPATVNGQTGFVLIPDNTILSVDFNAHAWEYSRNTYSASEWAKLEKNGAVFLPVAGAREGTTFISDRGYYWTSGAFSRLAEHVAFYSYIATNNAAERPYGCAVRLVKDVE